MLDALLAGAKITEDFIVAHPLAKDLLVAIVTSVLAAVFVRWFIRRREAKQRKRLLAPMRDLAVQSAIAAHGTLYSHLLAFGERDYKRLETRVAKIQGQFAATLAEFKVRMATYLDWFDQSEHFALFAYCGAADAKQIRASSYGHEVESWVKGINVGFVKLANVLPRRERELLMAANWDDRALDELSDSLYSRFRSPN